MRSILGASSMLEILTAPDGVLSETANPVKNVDGKIVSLIKEMGKALDAAKDPVGVGLAAPQVGASLRLFIAKPGIKSKTSVFINPRVLEASPVKKTGKKRIKKLEGCLSLPGIWGEVARSPRLTIEYQDQLGNHHTKTFKDFMATIIQHEIDHLDGVLFPKRVLEQKGKLYQSSKNEKGKDIFEEIEI